MDIQITLNRESSIILAEGRGRRWSFWNLLALGILFALALVFGGLWFALSRPIPIPDDTAIIGVISPRAAKQLFSNEAWNMLPENCRLLLSSDSDWPVICGLTSSGKTFAILPRWFSIPSANRYNAGLITRIGDVTTQKNTINYAQALSWRGLAKKPTIKLESSALEKTLGVETLTTSTSILLHWDGRNLKSDTTLPKSPNPLPAADIAFSISGTDWSNLPGELFLDAANLPDSKQWKPLPPIERYAVWHDAEGGISGRYLGFAENLDQEQAARVLGIMGVTERRQITLPDGTASFERLLPTANTTTNLFGRRQNDKQEWIDLDQRFMLVSSSSTTLNQNNIAPCGSSNPWLYLSSKALNDVLRLIGIQNQNTPPLKSGVQIFSDDQKLTICFE